MLRMIAISSLILLFAGCERSSRVIEPAPKTDKDAIRPENETSGGDTQTSTGKLQLEVSGFPSSISSVDLKVTLNGAAETRLYTLEGGFGSEIFGPLDPGSTSIKIQATASGVTYEGSANVTVRKKETSRVSIRVTSNGSSQPPGGGAPSPGGSSPTPGGNSPGPSGGNTPPPSNGESDAEISIDIGGSGTPGSSQQNIWDGKSFKGNSMFNIEPVK